MVQDTRLRLREEDSQRRGVRAEGATPSRVAYQAAFVKESEVEYPAVDAIEKLAGFALDRERLTDAARVLACPVKVNPPCWQHGRVIYATLRRYLSDSSGMICCLDVGTAKGFSALCAAWALRDSGAPGRVFSVDVIDPEERTRRNSVADCDGPTTVRELLAPWPEESRLISLQRSTSVDWLKHAHHVNFAFLDGKHRQDVVAEELRLLANRQRPGDVVIADDLQIVGVQRAVAEQSSYDVRVVTLLPNRRHAIMVKK